MTEQQRYRVIDARGDVELREYAPCVLADVTVQGAPESAGTAAFRPLFSYISGANRGRTSLAMTAPVLQEVAAPDSWAVSFVLPGDPHLQDYPTPTDPNVRLRDVPAHLAAALRWSGRWSAGNLEQHTQYLRGVMRDAGWVAAGEPRWARFNPPWTPPFLRHNEIVIPVYPPLGAGDDPASVPSTNE